MDGHNRSELIFDHMPQIYVLVNKFDGMENDKWRIFYLNKIEGLGYLSFRLVGLSIINGIYQWECADLFYLSLKHKDH